MQFWYIVYPHYHTVLCGNNRYRLLKLSNPVSESFHSRTTGKGDAASEAVKDKGKPFFYEALLNVNLFRVLRCHRGDFEAAQSSEISILLVSVVFLSVNWSELPSCDIFWTKLSLRDSDGLSCLPVPSVSSSWRQEPSVNGGGWNDMSLKIPGQMSTMEGNKWSAISAATHYRAQPEPQPWAQESQGTI